MAANRPLDINIDGMDPSAESPKRTAQQSRRSGGNHSSRNSSQKSKKQAKGLAGVVNTLKSTRTRLALGITLTIISLLMVIVLISYLRNGAADQSTVMGNSISAIANSDVPVGNAGGAAGAKLAHILFVDGLGISSFIIAFYLGALALALFGAIRLKFWSFTFKCLFTAVALSIIIGLFTYNSSSDILWGGNHGRYVNQWLFHFSDIIGAYAVSIFLIGMLVVMYFSQLRTAYVNASGTISRTRAAMADSATRARQPATDLSDIPESDVSESNPADKFTSTAGHDFEETPSEGISDQPNHEMAFTIDDDDEPVDDPSPAFTRSSSDESNPKTPLGSETAGDETEFNIVKNPIGGSGDKDIADFGDITASDFEPYDIRDELSRYAFPTPSLLIDRPVKQSIDHEEQEENKQLIVDTLKIYNIPINRIDATIGPTVTRYEILPADGVRIAQIKSLEDDIARSLAALGIRIIAPIPGTSNIGIEVPNRDPMTVSMRAVITSKKFRECNMALPMALGVTINNDIFITDLVKMPHLLVAGGTGQGKSVGLNCIIASLLYKKHPGELKFVLIDPKQLEFSLYERLEHHFLAKLPDEEEAIITDPHKAISALSSICVEMDNRYSMLKKAAVKNIEEYNRKFTDRHLNPEKGHKFMPYLVVIVDEFADLIATAGKDVLLHISRIVAKARAAGIHMILATQRPSTDVISGVIKSNFLGRIAFRVMQAIDSRVIIDQPGANRLIGRGDMLFSYNATLERVQCAFIDTPEVEALVDHIDAQIGYPTAYILPEPEREGAASVPGAIDLSKRDELFDECARFVVTNSSASTSSLQRRFSIGYNKAGKIMDQMEAAGIVGAADGQKPRPVLMTADELEYLLRSL